MKKAGVFATVVLALVVMGIRARGEEVPDDFKCGPIDCDVCKDHPNLRLGMQIAMAANGEPADLSKVGELRAEFWKTYPNGKGHEEAREKFAQALFLKDMYCLHNYMMFTVGTPVPNAAQRGEDMPAKVGEFLSGLVDGGIPRTARYEFYVWAEKVRANLAAAKNGNDAFVTGLRISMWNLSPAYQKACDLGGKDYQAYLMERDWAEFETAHRVPAAFDSKQGFGIYLYYRYGGYGFADARATYEGLKATLKDDKLVEDAAQEIRTAPRKDNGYLVVTVPEPLKRAPGGELVDDYDVPMPEKVIGTYRDPLVAFHMEIAQSGDRAYLLYLLGQQWVSNRKYLREKTSKWVYAGEAYQALVNAFGQKEVTNGAHAVRVAKKRMITGNIMDQKSLGATRNEPFGAFEDMMCWKDPAGFVKVAIAFAENMEHPERVDVAAEYRKLVGSDEKQVLEAAKRVAAKAPLIVTREEWGAIKTDMQRGPEPEKPAPVLVDAPDYVAWKKFGAGTKVNLITRTWYQPAPGSDKLTSKTSEKLTYTVKDVTADRVDYWLTEHVYDSNGDVHPPHDFEMAYPAKMPAADGGRARMRNPMVPKGTEMGPGRGRRNVVGGDVEKQEGEEDLEIGGRVIHTQWKSERYPVQVYSRGKGTLLVKLWTSDLVPGTLVRKTEDTVIPADKTHPGWRAIVETSVLSVEGAALLPGKAAATARSGDYVPPELGVSLAIPRPAKLETPPRVIQPQPVNLGRRASATPPAPVTPAPEVSERAAAMKHYQEVMFRERTAKSHLARLGRRVELPEDVKAANERLSKGMRDVLAAMAKQDYQTMEAGLKTHEEDVAVIENYLKERDGTTNGK